MDLGSFLAWIRPKRYEEEGISNWFGERVGFRQVELLKEGTLSEGNTVSKGLEARKCKAFSRKGR